MLKRKPYRWHWGQVDGDEGGVFDAKAHWAEYVNSDKTVTIHPDLRRKDKHDTLWTVLGHELVHQIYGDGHSTPATERRANRLEVEAGNVLHDFFHRFVNGGLPKCTGEDCHIKPK